MTDKVVSVGAAESVEVAARTLAQYNIGALPVCTQDGKLCGMVTDRDMVTRCIAPGKPTQTTAVRDVMSRQIVSVTPDTELTAASALMGRCQVRRLPVTENGKLCGMLSLADLATKGQGSVPEGLTLTQISDNRRA